MNARPPPFVPFVAEAEGETLFMSEMRNAILVHPDVSGCWETIRRPSPNNHPTGYTNIAHAVRSKYLYRFLGTLPFNKGAPSKSLCCTMIYIYICIVRVVPDNLNYHYGCRILQVTLQVLRDTLGDVAASTRHRSASDLLVVGYVLLYIHVPCKAIRT